MELLPASCLFSSPCLGGHLVRLSSRHGVFPHCISHHTTLNCGPGCSDAGGLWSDGQHFLPHLSAKVTLADTSPLSPPSCCGPSYLLFNPRKKRNFLGVYMTPWSWLGLPIAPHRSPILKMTPQFLVISLWMNKALLQWWAWGWECAMRPEENLHMLVCLMSAGNTAVISLAIYSNPIISSLVPTTQLSTLSRIFWIRLSTTGVRS